MKLYIVANRLPIKATSNQHPYSFVRSEGGLTTGLDSLHISGEKHWIGWPGICVDEEKQKYDISSQLKEMNLHPIFLSKQQYQNYYEGYSNSTLWPLCHYFFSYTLVKKDFWETYKKVNELFCEEICNIVKTDDWVWVHDYQLMLLPLLLRKRIPNLHIAYFHHIPFPSYELFRILPERAELLNGILGADFIAFHTYDYMRYFINASERVLNIDFKIDEVHINNRIVRINALPMGINYELYHRSTNIPEVWKEVEKNRILFGKRKLLLSVDRLDYSKGILHRLKGFEKFLQTHPEYHTKVTLAMVIVPSRDCVESYADLKMKIDETIGAINGRFSTMNWTPICYFYHSLSFEQLAALYFISDIALVTPLRDGMNLVAKEYVATKNNNPGVLILSEMAGAAAEMRGAIKINPNDIDQISAAIHEALTMPYEEQLKRLEQMQNNISTQTVNKWASEFLLEWKQTIEKNISLSSKLLNENLIEQLSEIYAMSHKRLIMLDYDGTLVRFEHEPDNAIPQERLLVLLQKLCNDSNNHIVINSGRSPEFLEKYLGQLHLDFAAEHGASYRENGEWHYKTLNPQWGKGILDILHTFVVKTPNSHLESKATSIVWHYRDTESWLGKLHAQQLIYTLLPICMQRNLQILPGNKVIEIKSYEHSKGSEVKRIINESNEKYDFIMAIGDDTTDDDMFSALPKNAFTIKIGSASKQARFNLPSQTQVSPLLEKLISNTETKNKCQQSRIYKSMNILKFIKKLLHV